MRFSLRLKLTLTSLLLLLIPLFGLRFSEMISDDLLKSRKETMLFSARAVASTLMGRTGLFAREQFLSLNPSTDLYLYPLVRPVRINGQNDDWKDQPPQLFGSEHQIYSDGQASDFRFSHRLGVWRHHLYAIFEVEDDDVVYRRKNSLRLDFSDYLEITVESDKGLSSRYLLTTDRPGWVNGFLMPDDVNDPYAGDIEPRIQGMWVETDTGYIIEMRLPMELVEKKLAFAIADVRNASAPRVAKIISTGGAGNSGRVGQAIAPSREIQQILQGLDRPNSRVLIIDSNKQVRASFGHLLDEDLEEERSVLGRISQVAYRLFRPIYKLFLQPFSKAVVGIQPTSLNIEGLGQVLNGKSVITLYTPKGENTEIMAAVVPLMENQKIIGAVVVEQTTNSILALQNKLIEESLTLTIFSFFFGGVGLLFFASRLSSRIRRLRDQAAHAISSTGTVRSTVPHTTTRDEVGDLSRTLAMMLRQIKEQNEYREKMADNLEHEMRTPLAGASASLKNLARELKSPDERIENYLQWAISDIHRMENLLTVIRDANNLQDALARDMKEDFDLARALPVWLEHGWKPAFAGVRIQLSAPVDGFIVHGDPGRIRQMCDKIIENAVSFHDPGTDIEITLDMTDKGYRLSIANEGEELSVEQQNQIFNSMVSLRHRKDDRPHLGLGLFVARTIIEHHDGKIEVSGLEDGRKGVTFNLFFPHQGK